METGTVLIVEDEDPIRKVYATALKLAGFNVLEARDGKEGVSMALVHNPNVILMDIMMPNMNGHEAIEEIRKDAWGKNAKVMYLTNLNDVDNIARAIREKSDEYIVKANISVKDLVKRVEKLMFEIRPDNF